MSRLRRSAALVFACTAAVGACSVAYDLSDYATGSDKDAALDSEGTDSSSTVDSAREDTESVDTGSPADTSVVDSATAEDTGSPVDSSAVDSGADTAMADTTVVDTAVVDTAAVDSADTSVVDTGPCTGLCLFGVSEVMVRAVSGTGDKREWLELTNYNSSAFDVSGITVKVFSGATEKASFTFPPSTTLAADEAVVIADDDVAFKADVVAGYALGRVFSFGTKSDVFVNSAPIIRLYAPGSTTPFETAAFSRSWPASRSYAYPLPSAGCPATSRFVASTGADTPPWKDAPVDPAQKYGEYPVGTALYGTPTKPNVGIACP